MKKRCKLFQSILELMRINSNIHYFQVALSDRYFYQLYRAYYTGCCINMLVRSLFEKHVSFISYLFPS